MPRNRANPSLNREDVQRRLRAARAFAGFRSPQALADQPLMQRYGIPASRVVQTEAMRRDAEPWELEVIARACGLPTSFLTGEDAAEAGTLASIAAALARIEAKIDSLTNDQPEDGE